MNGIIISHNKFLFFQVSQSKSNLEWICDFFQKLNKK